METINETKRTNYDDKIWLSHEDIVRLYGPISKKALIKPRQERKITWAKHPLNAKAFIYLRADIEALIEQTIVPSKMKLATNEINK